MEKFDVVIIGAGVIGAMVAREASKYTKSVAIIEKESDVAMGASGANSAIVHAGFDAKEGSLKARFNVEGSRMMEKTAQELGVKYKRNGSLVCAFDEEGLCEIETLLKRGKKNGVEGLEIIGRDEVLKKEPNLSPDVKGALWAPTGAIVCPYDLTVAATGNAMDNGASLYLENEVVGILKKDNEWIVETDKNKFQCKILINSAGIYSDKIARMTGDDTFSVSPRRGEYLLYDKVHGALVASTVFTPPTKMGKGILITPTPDSNLLLGPTAENIDDKEDTRTTREGLDEILEKAKAEINALPKNTITSFTGLRAVGSTGDFIIREENGIVTLAGIESPGLSSSPAIAKYVAETVFEKYGFTKREDFNPTRTPSHFFSSLSDEEKSEFIKKNPLWAKIVCRCEEITEGEIISAIHQNPPARTVDAIKRRTRATMGRCQGGFCVPHIVEIMSRELKLPPEKITKKGGNSHLIAYKKG